MVFESSLSGKTVQETRDVPVAISPAPRSRLAAIVDFDGGDA